MQSGETTVELKALHHLGWSISALARHYGLSRLTVRRELASPGPRSYSERAKPTELNEAQLIHIERRLSVCPGIRGTDLHAELRHEYGYDGSYPALRVRDHGIGISSKPLTALAMLSFGSHRPHLPGRAARSSSMVPIQTPWPGPSSMLA